MLPGVTTDRDPSPPVDPRIARAALGDRAAAQALLSELLPRVRNLVRYLAQGDGEVDDIAQLVLIQVVRSFGSYRGEGTLHAFVDRITVRVTLAYVRKRRSDARRVQNLAPELHAVSLQPGAPDSYAERRRVLRLLDALPSEQREVIVLHHVVGLSAPELAEELRIPLETARSRLRLGMTKLRERLSQESST